MTEFLLLVSRGLVGGGDSCPREAGKPAVLFSVIVF